MHRKHLEKKAALGELIALEGAKALGAHIGQNIVARHRIKNGKLFDDIANSLVPEKYRSQVPTISQNNNNTNGKFSKAKQFLKRNKITGPIIEGTKNTIVPEKPILKNEVVHLYHNIKEMPYKNRVMTIHALKGNWSRLQQSPEGRKALANIAAKVHPQGHLITPEMIAMMPPQKIKELETAYKNHEMGKGIAGLTDKLKKPL